RSRARPQYWQTVGPTAQQPPDRHGPPPSQPRVCPATTTITGPTIVRHRANRRHRTGSLLASESGQQPSQDRVRQPQRRNRIAATQLANRPAAAASLASRRLFVGASGPLGPLRAPKLPKRRLGHG